MDLCGCHGPGLLYSFPCAGHFPAQILPCDWLRERPLGALGWHFQVPPCIPHPEALRED